MHQPLNLRNHWRLLVRYGVAPVTVGLTLACRLALDPLMGNASPFLYFMLSILISSWLGGWAAGLAATVLSNLAVAYYYLEPMGTLRLASHQETIQVVSFLVLGGVISLIVSMLRQTLERAERAKRTTEENEIRYRAIYEHADIGLERLDEEGRLLEVNPALCRMLGFTQAELLARNWAQITHPDDLAEDNRQLERLKRREIQSYKLEKRYLRQDGQLVWVRLTSSLAPEGAGFFRISVIEDISERKAAEMALAESQQRLRGIVESAMDAIISVDAEQRIVLFNSAAEEMFRCSAREALGSPLDRFIPGPFRAAHREHIRNFDRTGQTARAMGQLRPLAALRADGEEFPIEASISQVQVAGQKLFTAILRDITERKQAQEELERRVAERTAQLRELNAKLELSNRELQDFAFVASHDLQEPLRKVMAFGDILIHEHREALGETGADYLRRMQSAANRMQALISDLLQLSRVTSKAQPFAMVDLGQVVAGVLTDLDVRIKQSGGRVEVGELAMLEADPTQMRQLLQNLISNAIKFARPEAPPLVRISAQPEPAPEARAGEEPGRQRFQLRVADNGIGFEEKYLDRIFTVFQRLHERGAYEGTGIGLAICRKIVERHGGSITARSRPGEGSTFIVTLPYKQTAKKE